MSAGATFTRFPVQRRCGLNGSSSFLVTVEQPCHKKVDPPPQPRLPLPADGFGLQPGMDISLQTLEIQRQTSTSKRMARLFSFSPTASTVLSAVFAQLQLGFPKGFFFSCSIGIGKTPRIKAMPTFSAFKCTSIFSPPSIPVPSCRAGARPRQRLCACGGRRSRSGIPCARAALASAGRSDAPTSTSALELFVHCGTLGLCWLATTLPIYRRRKEKKKVKKE